MCGLRLKPSSYIFISQNKYEKLMVKEINDAEEKYAS